VAQPPYSPTSHRTTSFCSVTWNNIWKESISRGKTRWLLRSGRFLTTSRCRCSRTWRMIGNTDWEGLFNSGESTFFS
jgi:hypothetical protein